MVSSARAAASVRQRARTWKARPLRTSSKAAPCSGSLSIGSLVVSGAGTPGAISGGGRGFCERYEG